MNDMTEIEKMNMNYECLKCNYYENHEDDKEEEYEKIF
jgi:hypothetical protein